MESTIDPKADNIEIVDRLTRHAPERNAQGEWVLAAERDWMIQGPEALLRQVQAAFGSALCETLTPALLLVRFGNNVGYFDVPPLGRVEVVSGKWRPDHFDRMLADVMAVASALPFSAGTGGALPYDRLVMVRKDILYHTFVYLRYILSDRAPAAERLLPALRIIVGTPHRCLERFEQGVPVDQASWVSASNLVQVLSHAGRTVPVKNPKAQQLPLVQKLQGYLPSEVTQSAVYTSVDTPENRFVLMFLRFLEGILEAMEEALTESGTDLFVQQVRQDCLEMAQALKPVRQHPLWREVGPMIHLPASSTVLQRRRGYRDTFRHFSKVRLAARIPLTQMQMKDLLEAKDIALLYEIWTFFTVAKAVEEIIGLPLRADAPQINALQLSIPYGLSITWLGGTVLYYNRSFSRTAPPGQNSYSVPLRPDIVLEVPTGVNAGLHLFDAKFKLDRIDMFLSEAEETEGEASAERQGTFKQGDLYKMHTYRDAIARARSVWILYPGTELRLFRTDGAPSKDMDSLPRAALTGVGAIPLQPSAQAQNELAGVLRLLLGH